MRQTVVKMWLVVILAAAPGCKIHIDIPVKMSMLQTTPSISNPTTSEPIIYGTIRVEIPSCHEFGDTRKPSSSLLETKSKIPSIFKGAEFKDCYSKNLVTFAEFSIPVSFDKQKDGKFAHNDYINIISLGRQILAVGIPPSIKTQLELFNNDSFTPINLEPTVSINLKNDTGRAIDADLVGVYVNDYPVHMETVTFPIDRTVVVKLSDVATGHAIRSGIAAVILHPNTTIKRK